MTDKELLQLSRLAGRISLAAKDRQNKITHVMDAHRSLCPETIEAMQKKLEDASNSLNEVKEIFTEATNGIYEG